MQKRSPARFRFLLVLPSLALLLGACGADPAPQDTPLATAAIIHFAAPERAAAGETIRLDWITSHATSFSLFANDEPVEVPRERWPSGGLDLEVQGPTRLLLEVVGPNKRRISIERAVWIDEGAEVAIERFAATPGRIAAGQTAAVAWATKEASSIRLTDDRGQPLSLDQSLPSAGSLLVRPTRSTTYTLVATGTNGSSSATTAIQVVPPPRVTAQVSRGVIEAGDEVRIEWQAPDADSLTIWEGNRELLQLDPLEAAEGHLVAHPLQATTYRLEARNIAGVAQASAQVEVVPVIERFALASDPGRLRLGMSIPLAWQVRGADSVLLSDREGLVSSWEGDPGAASWGDQLQHLVRVAGPLELVARNGKQEVRRNLELLLAKQPVIATFTVDSLLQLASPGSPAQVSLRWEVFGARTLLLHAIPGGIVQLPPSASSSGTWLVEVDGPTTFTLLAENPWGTDEETLDAKVEAPPDILRFDATPMRVAAGAAATLRWEVASAATVEIWRDEVRLSTSAGEEAGLGAYPIVVATGGRYELRAFNAAGGQARAFTDVEIGAPTIDSFDSARQWFAPQETVSLTWRSSGGDRLELRQDGSLLFSSEDPDTIRAGTAAVPAPATAGAASYTLSISNGAGAAHAVVAATVTEGPILLRLEAQPDRITAGDELELRWSLRSGAVGQAATLILRDDEDRIYLLSPEDLAGGQTRLRLETPGLYEFILQATGPAGGSIVSVAAEVLPPPTLLSNAATPTFAQVEGSAVVVSWTTANAAQLLLYATDDAGQQIGNALHSTAAPAELAAGSFEVYPTLAAPNVRLALFNELGAERTFDLGIGVSPPQIALFEALPATIERGASSTLVWATERSPLVELEVTQRVETNEPFLDLEGLPGATALAIGPGPFDTARLTFPGGFTFPFDGANRRGVSVANAGYLSFDLVREGGVQAVAGFPDPNTPSVHLAPFLGKLERGTGALLYASIEDGDGLVIQFRGYSLAGAPSSRLNFEVVLWAGGGFDFRYGGMSLASDPAAVAGAAAQIGSQDARGQRGATFTNKAAVPGGLAGRSFHHPTVELLIGVEAETRPYLSIAGAPNAVELTEGSRFFTNALFNFPSGFTFPFAGARRSAARITKDGYLSFETRDEISHGANRQLAQGAAGGAGGTSRLVHLAPFWANLSRIHGAGEIWAAIQDDGGGRALVIQWLRFAHETDPASRLDFEIVLRESGSFEFRYGTMFRESGGLAEGNGLASIGYQEPNGVRGVGLFFREEIPGGLSWRGWRFVPRPAFPPAGAIEVRPRSTVDYRLSASGPNGIRYLVQTLEVIPPPGSP